MRTEHILVVMLALLCGGCSSPENLRLVGEGGSGGGGGAGGTGGVLPRVVCGDGVREGDEACDGLDLAGESCLSLGFDGGTLVCGTTCNFVTRGCVLTEKCDNGIDDDGDGLIDCADSDCAGKPPCPFCGDGVRNADEACDGLDLGGATCSTSGFEIGELSCTGACQLDTSACSWLEDCANGIDDDGNGLVDCADPGCEGRAPCPRCGDGSINVAGEACDGSAVEALCSDFGYQLGVVGCTDVCALDLSDCRNPEDCSTPGDEDGDGLADCDDPDCDSSFECPTCGNGIVQRGEACDGEDVPFTCQDHEFDTGVPGCTEACSTDLSGCRNFVCGDGVVEGSERCDDGNLTAGDGCSPDCLVEGDVCEAAMELVWDVVAGAWVWDGDASHFFSDYPTACGDTTNFPDMVAFFTAPAAGAYYASVQAEFDTVLSAWDGTCGIGSPQIQCEDSWYQRGAETIEMDLSEGQTIFLVVGESWTTSSGTSLAGPFRLEVGAVICGDGVRTGLEQCDDGNSLTGDGCDADCRWEGDGCLDAFDLNLYGGQQANDHWPPWLSPLRGLDTWFWAASTAEFGADFAAPVVTTGGVQCGGGAGRDGVARFQAPYTGRFEFHVLAGFEATLYFFADCGQSVTELGCGWPRYGVWPGVARMEASAWLDLTAGQVVYVVIDGVSMGDSGDFWLIVLPIALCGNGVVERNEQCDEGNPGSPTCPNCSLPRAEEREPNDTQAQANALPAGLAGRGWLLAAPSHTVSPSLIDLDMWSFGATAGTTYRISTANRFNDCAPGGLDTYLRLYDSNGGLVAENDDAGGTRRCSEILWTASSTSRMVVEVGLSSFTWPMVGPYYFVEPWMRTPEGLIDYLLFIEPTTIPTP